MNQLTIISDVHGKKANYVNIVRKRKYTVQLGDLSVDNYNFLNHIDGDNHVFIAGNHDNFDILDNNPPKNYLGRYGLKTLNDVEFFYLGGAFSIDKIYRLNYEFKNKIKCWWPQEEATEDEFENAYNLYCSLKPNIVITHDCPRRVANLAGNPRILREFGFDDDFTTRTSEWLQKMWDFHAPRTWVFGHFHTNFDQTHFNGKEATRFICKPELGLTTIDTEGAVC